MRTQTTWIFYFPTNSTETRVQKNIINVNHLVHYTFLHEQKHKNIMIFYNYQSLCIISDFSIIVSLVLLCSDLWRWNFCTNQLLNINTNSYFEKLFCAILKAKKFHFRCSSIIIMVINNFSYANFLLYLNTLISLDKLRYTVAK